MTPRINAMIKQYNKIIKMETTRDQSDGNIKDRIILDKTLSINEIRFLRKYIDNFTGNS